MAIQAKLLIALALCLFACGPQNQTPIEQPPLRVISAAHQSDFFLTIDAVPSAAPVLVKVAEEFRRLPVTVHIVWQCRVAPSTAMLAEFPGKNFQQLHDPHHLTPPTNGLLRAGIGLIPLQLIPLRLAFARASALPILAQ